MDGKTLKLGPKAIPQGTRTYLFEEAAHKRFMEHALHSVLRSRGFQEIVTTPIEYYESMIAGLNEEERNRVMWFTEGETGRIVALRADITSQVARSAATHLSGRPHPLRLCYTGAVFRKTRAGKGERCVLHQSGMEIIGDSSGAQADIEVMLSTIACLQAARFKNFSISLGHAAFSASFLNRLEPAYVEPVKNALKKKDKTSLKKHLEKSGIGSGYAQKIIAVTKLYGGGEVLRKAAELCGANTAGKKALKNLTAIYSAVKKAHPNVKLSIDLGEMRGFGYYSGVIFEVFSANGHVIGSGGRYDNLVKRFGPDSPAVGFAFDIDRMIETFQSDNDALLWRASDVLLIGANEKTANEMRSAGLMVTTPFGTMNDSRAKSYARKMSIPYILRKMSGESYNLADVASGEKRKCSLPEFINEFFK